METLFPDRRDKLNRFSTISFTAFYGPAVATPDAIAVLKKAYDMGCRHFDTAQIYQQFKKPEDMPPNTYPHNEQLVSDFIKEVGRENITVATK